MSPLTSSLTNSLGLSQVQQRKFYSYSKNSDFVTVLYRTVHSYGFERVLVRARTVRYSCGMVTVWSRYGYSTAKIAVRLRLR